MGATCPRAWDVLDRKLAVLREHCRAGRAGSAQVQVTVLDIPVIGEDRAHAAAIVENLRGRTPAATFARRHHAGTAADHIGRYRLLAERGVQTVFVSLPRPDRPRGRAAPHPAGRRLRLSTAHSRPAPGVTISCDRSGPCTPMQERSAYQNRRLSVQDRLAVPTGMARG